MKKISEDDVNTVAYAFDAIAGLVSEQGPECLDSFYRLGNGEKMMNDFQSVLERLGVEIIQ